MAEKQVPNVNFFLKYVDSVKGRTSSDEYLKEHLEERRFYSSVKDDDYIKYVNKGSNEKLDYVEYSGNNEKSHGVFNEKGLMKPEDIKELRKQLRSTESPIWHGVISFTEKFGNDYCNTYKKAYQLLKYEFPKFFKNAGLNPDNIVWYAGLHENTDNKHIHISFFEKNPERYKQGLEGKYYSDGFISKKAMDRFKVSIELKLLRLADEVILHRKTLTTEMKNKIKSGDYMEQIDTLLYLIPRKGKIGYESENMRPYREKIKLVANTIIKADKDLKKTFLEFERFLLIRDEEIKKAFTRINVDYKDKLLHDKIMEDIYTRLGNAIIFSIIDIRKAQNFVEYETNSRLAKKRIEKNKKKILLKQCVRLNDLVNREIMNAFEEYRYKLAEANFKRLQEEGVLD